jgi:hypothetical protein
MRRGMFLTLMITLLTPVASLADAIPGVPFTLGVGELAVVAGLDATVGFDGVAADSRCPINVICVWEGDAAASLWVTPVGGERTSFVLHTSPMFQRAKTVGPVNVQLLDVTPYPVSPGWPDPGAYHVLINVTRSTTAPAEASTWGAIKGLYR